MTESIPWDEIEEAEERQAEELRKLTMYMKRLIDAEKAGERSMLIVGPFGAMTMIGMLQLALRHPDVPVRSKAVVRDIIRQMEPLFSGTEGEEIIRRGFDE